MSNDPRRGTSVHAKRGSGVEVQIQVSKAYPMDDLLREFLTETSESLDTVDNQLVKFEQELSLIHI